jgi:hypothetical protein
MNGLAFLRASARLSGLQKVLPPGSSLARQQEGVQPVIQGEEGSPTPRRQNLSKAYAGEAQLPG